MRIIIIFELNNRIKYKFQSIKQILNLKLKYNKVVNDEIFNFKKIINKYKILKKVLAVYLYLIYLITNHLNLLNNLG